MNTENSEFKSFCTEERCVNKQPLTKSRWYMKMLHSSPERSSSGARPFKVLKPLLSSRTAATGWERVQMAQELQCLALRVCCVYWKPWTDYDNTPLIQKADLNTENYTYLMRKHTKKNTPLRWSFRCTTYFLKLVQREWKDNNRKLQFSCIDIFLIQPNNLCIYSAGYLTSEPKCVSCTDKIQCMWFSCQNIVMLDDTDIISWPCAGCLHGNPAELALSRKHSLHLSAHLRGPLTSGAACAAKNDHFDKLFSLRAGC